MRIAYVLTSPDSTLDCMGGSTTHIREVLKSFSKLGHPVCSIIAQDIIPSQSSRLAQPDKPKAYLFLKRSLPGFVWEIAKEIAYFRYNKEMYIRSKAELLRFSPEIIYERAELRANTGVHLAKELKIPYVLEMNDPFIFGQGLPNGPIKVLRKKLEIRKVSSADHILTASASLKNFLIHKLSVLPEKITALPNGADLDLFNPALHEGSRIRRKYQLDGKIVIGISGFFAPYHGVDCLLEAARELKGEDIALLLVGSAADSTGLQKRIADLGLGNRVILTGMVDFREVPSYLAAMDIAVMPNSNWFGSPIKIFEYGAMQKAIIAPKVGPVLEVMENGKDGILIQPNSREELVEGIQRFLRNPGFSRSCAESFRRKVASRYRWDLHVKKIIAIMEELL